MKAVLGQIGSAAQPDSADPRPVLFRLGIRFDPLSSESASTAGYLWRESRVSAKGSHPSRDRVVADFLIGSHAAHQADALLTRDHGFYRQHFKALKVLDPTEARR